MKAKLIGHKDFTNLESSQDSIGLLKIIREFSFHFDSKTYPAMAIVIALTKLHRFVQGREMLTSIYYQRFCDHIGVIDHFGGTIGEHPFLVEAEFSKIIGISYDPTKAYTGSPYVELLARAKRNAQDSFLACLFLANACQHRYGDLLDTLHNQYVVGLKTYPTTLEASYSLLDEIKKP